MDRWLRKQIAHLRSLEWYANEGDVAVFQEAAEIIREAGKRLIDAGRPITARLCRAGDLLSPVTAQEILSACIDKPQQLTPPQAAQRLGVSPDTVRRWIENGELQAVNVADAKSTRPRYRIDPDALAEFDKQRQPKGKPNQPPQTRRRKQSADLIVRRFSSGH